MEAIILSGGLGTRLRSVVSIVPKVMAPINSVPFLQYTLEKLYSQGFERVILATGYKKEYIKNYFGNQYKGMELCYSEETIPLGTGGAIKKALKMANDNDVIIMNGDIYTDMDFNELMRCHKQSNQSVTISLMEMEKFDMFGSVTLSAGYITSFNEKKYVDLGYMNVGCYVFSKNILNFFEENVNFSIEKDFFNKYSGIIKMNPYFYKGEFIDIGIPENYEKAKKLIKK